MSDNYLFSSAVLCYSLICLATFLNVTYIRDFDAIQVNITPIILAIAGINLVMDEGFSYALCEQLSLLLLIRSLHSDMKKEKMRSNTHHLNFSQWKAGPNKYLQRRISPCSWLLLHSSSCSSSLISSDQFKVRSFVSFSLHSTWSDWFNSSSIPVLDFKWHNPTWHAFLWHWLDSFALDLVLSQPFLHWYWWQTPILDSTCSHRIMLLFQNISTNSKRCYIDLWLNLLLTMMIIWIMTLWRSDQIHLGYLNKNQFKI